MLKISTILLKKPILWILFNHSVYPYEEAFFQK